MVVPRGVPLRFRESISLSAPIRLMIVSWSFSEVNCFSSSSSLPLGSGIQLEYWASICLDLGLKVADSKVFCSAVLCSWGHSVVGCSLFGAGCKSQIMLKCWVESGLCFLWLLDVSAVYYGFFAVAQFLAEVVCLFAGWVASVVTRQLTSWIFLIDWSRHISVCLCHIVICSVLCVISEVSKGFL